MGRLPAFAIDLALVALLIGGGLYVVAGQPGFALGDRAGHRTLVVAAILPLLMRRRFPFLTLVAVAVVIGIAGSIGPPLSLNPGFGAALALLIATFGAASAVRRELTWITLALPVAAITLVLRPWVLPVAAWLPEYPPFVVAFVAGLAQRQRRELTVALQDRLRDEQVHRDRLHQLALQEARAGLARDLRDVVAFALKQMGARARDALRRLGPPPQDPQPVIAATEAEGRAALKEMRRLLTVLRTDADGRDEAAEPEPGGGYTVSAPLSTRGVPGRRDVRGAFEHAIQAVETPVPHADSLRLSRARSAFRTLVRREWLVDVLLVVVLSVGALLEFRYWEGAIGLVAPPPVFSTEARMWAIGWIFLLLFRRRAPVATGVAMSAMAFLQSYPFGYWTPTSDLFALEIAVYTVGSRKPGRPHVWVVAAFAAVGIWSIQPLRPSLVAFLILRTFLLGAVAYVGTVVGERRKLIGQLEESLRSVDEERRTRVALAMQQDRLALAREMHDLVAHTLSLMVMQSGAARTVADSNPEAARNAIGTVIEASGQANKELHQLLSLLRGRGTEGGAPAVGDVEQLVIQARGAGMEVEFHRTGSPPLPVGSTLEAFQYRIVQEALTNARKHAPGSTAKVLLEHDAEAVVIRVENDGAAANAQGLTASGAGHGLLGMRERVAIVGGQLQAGPTPTGGFVVEAVMPREAAAA